MDDVEKRPQPADFVEKGAGERGGEIEAEAIRVHLDAFERSESMMSWKHPRVHHVQRTFPQPV